MNLEIYFQLFGERYCLHSDSKIALTNSYRAFFQYWNLGEHCSFLLNCFLLLSYFLCKVEVLQKKSLFTKFTSSNFSLSCFFFLSFLYIFNSTDIRTRLGWRLPKNIVPQYVAAKTVFRHRCFVGEREDSPSLFFHSLVALYLLNIVASQPPFQVGVFHFSQHPP